jgi:hypothetical protein
MQGGVPRFRRETTRMRPRARGYVCISCVGLCSQHLSQGAPQTEHVVPSYGRSKLGEIGPEKALFTMIPPDFDHSYLSATRSVWGVLGLIRSLHVPVRPMARLAHACNAFRTGFRPFQCIIRTPPRRCKAACQGAAGKPPGCARVHEDMFALAVSGCVGNI